MKVRERNPANYQVNYNITFIWLVCLVAAMGDCY